MGFGAVCGWFCCVLRNWQQKMDEVRRKLILTWIIRYSNAVLTRKINGELRKLMLLTFAKILFSTFKPSGYVKRSLR